jgi:hypothetical protein
MGCVWPGGNFPRLPARNAEGVVLGQEVLKLDQNGKVLMMLGKMGVGGSGTDTFDRPTGVAIAANGDIFVSDGHGGNASNNGRVVIFSTDGRFIKTGVTKDRRPAISMTRTIFVGGSQGRVYVADRLSSRIQVFDQDGNFVTAWHQLGQPTSLSARMIDSMSALRSAMKRPDATHRRDRSRANCAALWSAAPSTDRCSLSYLIRPTSIPWGPALRLPVLRLTRRAMSMPPISAPTGRGNTSGCAEQWRLLQNVKGKRDVGHSRDAGRRPWRQVTEVLGRLNAPPY